MYKYNRFLKCGAQNLSKSYLSEVPNRGSVPARRR